MPINPKRASYFEEEIIEVKPSIELIPDEYEHFQDSPNKIVLHTFIAKDEYDEQNETMFLDTLKQFGIEAASTNRHSLNTDDFGSIIHKIVKASSTDDGGLIMLFSGLLVRDGHLQVFDGNKLSFINIQTIWSRFDSYNCPKLKNKPKFFIFILSVPVEQIQTDSKKYYGNMQDAYETPAEADILVVCNKSNGDDDFMEQLCDNIKMFGDTENIMTLLSCTESPTIIISTLTRNFYFTSSNLRGHQHVIDKNNEHINTHLKEVKNVLDKKKDEMYKISNEKKEKSSIFQSFKNVIKPKVDQKKRDNIKAGPSNASKPKSSTIPSKRQDADASRKRLTSQTETDEKRPSIRKLPERPNWKP